MDFSSTERALSSLQRRKPSLSPKVVTLANTLQSIHKSTTNTKTSALTNPIFNPQYVKCTTDLLRIGTVGEGEEEEEQSDSKIVDTDAPIQAQRQESSTHESKALLLRWEPLAVGLHLTATYLQNATSFYCNNNGSNQNVVYMDGPRVPSIAPSQTPSPSSPHESKDDDINGTSTSSNTANIDENQLLQFSQFIMTICQTHLEHNEPRVRSLVAKVVGEHTKLGTSLYTQNHTLGRTIIDRSIALYHTTNTSLKEHLASGRDTKNKSKSSDGALDDTTGWRALETNIFGLGSFVHASGALYFELIRPQQEQKEGKEDNDHDPSSNLKKEYVMDETLLENLEYCCITHVNRHVRAAALALLEQMVHACASSIDKQSSNANTDNTEKNEVDHGVMEFLLSPKASLRKTILKILKVTLADNWSQVRMAASVLCRVFYVTLLDYAERHPSIISQADTWLTSTYPLLLPRMCLNRFYLAQGVKLYSHDTWRIIFERSEQYGCMGGVESVALNAAPICRYYVQMCDADNHVVREAACQAVAELATKLGRSVKFSEYLAPYVVMLLQVCFV